MGFEAFRVELRGGQADGCDARRAVEQLPYVHPDRNSLPMKGSTYYLVEDGGHVIEIEVMDAPVKVSCRFTLCHPASVDLVFLGVLRELMGRLGMKATICDDIYPMHSRSFSLAEFPEFQTFAKHTIDVRRVEWIAAFGNETLAASTNEVYERIILPQCQPVVKQPTRMANR